MDGYEVLERIKTWRDGIAGRASHMEARLERITRAEYSRWNLPGWRMEDTYVRWDGARIVRGA